MVKGCELHFGFTIALPDCPLEVEYTLGRQSYTNRRPAKHLIIFMAGMPFAPSGLPRSFRILRRSSGGRLERLRKVRRQLGLTRSQNLQLAVDAVVALSFLGSHGHMVPPQSLSRNLIQWHRQDVAWASSRTWHGHLAHENVNA